VLAAGDAELAPQLRQPSDAAVSVYVLAGHWSHAAGPAADL